MSVVIGGTSPGITSLTGWPKNVSLSPEDFLAMLEAMPIDTLGTAAVAAIVNAANAMGAVVADRIPKVAIKALSGATIHAGVDAWANPEAVSIIITKVIVDVTTVASAAAKLDIGTTATSITTASDNLIDGIDVNAATGLLGQADGDGTTNSKLQQKLAAGKWVTIKEISGNTTGLVGNLYIQYMLV